MRAVAPNPARRSLSPDRPNERRGRRDRASTTAFAATTTAPADRFLSYAAAPAINLSIAVLALAILGGLYWYGWRTLPQTSGTITAPISSRATIIRDERGVPHITAGSWQDAIFLQGYVTAQDRLWQMDALRRMAAGQLAEVVGKTALESDEDSLRWRMARIAEQQERELTPYSREMLAAYARGVNYFIETHRDSLPPEFAILHYDPRPWTMRDSLLAALQMNRLLTNTWREEMNKFHMLQSGDQDKVGFLLSRAAPAMRFSPDPTPGPSPARILPPASRSLPTIRTLSGTFPVPGTWCI